MDDANSTAPLGYRVMERAAARALLISRKGRKAIVSKYPFNMGLIVESELLDGEID